ncbi:MAG: NAD(P)H-binding protein [Nakamurella sp.]
MIVVAGGSGLLGQHVVNDLLARGESVRVLVRDAPRARALWDDSVEVVAGDVRRADGLADQCAGASVVVSAVHGFLGGRGAGPVEVDERGNANLVAAAAAAGADVVMVSVLGASPDSPVDLFRAKCAAERQLRGSRTAWTIVRASAYLETWLAVLGTTAGKSGHPLIFGRGERPIWMVSALDVAAVVSRAATDSSLRGQVLEVAGQPITMTELARALQNARGWDGSPRHLPRPALRILAVLARPISPAFARQNRTALAMDTGTLTASDPAAGQSWPSRQTLPEVLAGFTEPDGR